MSMHDLALNEGFSGGANTPTSETDGDVVNGKAQHVNRRALILTILLCTLAWMFAPLRLTAQVSDPCPGYQAWVIQAGPRSDPTGLYNNAYPEANATYWATFLTQPAGSTVIMRGQYPLARYMSFQLYDGQNVVDSINDVTINPDAGQNNPYRTGIAQGTYTVHIVFGRAPRRPAPNTIYAGTLTSVIVLYRIYYANNPDDLAGGPVDPRLPTVFVGGVALSSCPTLPVITPENLTVWGRLDDNEFTGTKPATTINTNLVPQWRLAVTGPATPYYPSEDNSYMTVLLDRTYLNPPYNFELVVIRMKAPTFTDTQNGVAPYASADMRFWSMCTDEPILSSVTRCIPDDRAINVNGFVTFVISDPSKRPSADVLSQWGAVWLPWGALGPGDVMYNINGLPLSNADGVFYYNLMLYRQTIANPAFAQSIKNIAQLPFNQQKNAMGDYWPTIGYCTKATFQTKGPACFGR